MPTKQRNASVLPTLSSISAYLKEIDQVPLLTREEEQNLTKSFANCCQEHTPQTPCPECSKIKNTLITANLRFVVSVAKKYQGNNLSLTDLINEGNIGLITAVDKFDPSMGFHFISYAVWWIKQSIMKAISEKSRMIRLPMNRTNELFRIAKFIDEYTKEYNQRPSESQIEQATKINRCDIKRILDISSGHSSIEEMHSKDYDQESIQKEFVDHSHCPERTMLGKALQNNIFQLLGSISDRERIILIHRYGLNGAETLSLSKIGEILGITKERVRQLEKQALNTIKKSAEDQGLSLYFE